MGVDVVTPDENRKLRELLAEREISRVIHQYAHAADRGDVAMMTGCFWPDATLDLGVFRGPVTTFLDGVRTGAADTNRISRHMLGNILIEVDLAARRARAETYCSGGSRMLDSAGVLVERMAHVRYVDRFIERDGQWRIHCRVVAFDWATAMPAPGDTIVHPGFLMGRRGPDDIWEQILDLT